jgi:hypothetical protein
MSILVTATPRRWVAMVLAVAFSSIMVWPLTGFAADPATIADLNRLGAATSDSQETVVTKAKELISANFPDFTPRTLSPAEYQAEFTRRGHVSDEIRKTLKRLKLKFKSGALPESDRSSANPNRRRDLDFSEYEYDAQMALNRTRHSFQGKRGALATQEAAVPNPMPWFVDTENWIEQFARFDQNHGELGPNGSERVRKLSKNLGYMLQTLREDFRYISRSRASTYIVSGRADKMAVDLRANGHSLQALARHCYASDPRSKSRARCCRRFPV